MYQTGYRLVVLAAFCQLMGLLPQRSRIQHDDPGPGEAPAHPLFHFGFHVTDATEQVGQHENRVGQVVDQILQHPAVPPRVLVNITGNEQCAWGVSGGRPCRAQTTGSPTFLLQAFGQLQDPCIEGRIVEAVFDHSGLQKMIRHTLSHGQQGEVWLILCQHLVDVEAQVRHHLEQRSGSAGIMMAIIGCKSYGLEEACFSCPDVSTVDAAVSGDTTMT